MKRMVIGKSSEKGFLTEQGIRKICIDAFSQVDLENKRIIVLIPDSTRSGPVGLFFKLFCDIIGKKSKKLDFLIALGTHQPMKDEKILEFLGISADERKNKYGKFNIFNHRWDIPGTFKTIGKISADEIHEISGGLFKEEVPVAINKLIFEYDLYIIYGPVFPHEVAGFSGGNKYLFPGIAAFEIINFFHWLGAMITNIKINGVKHTPTRKIIDRAASFLKIPSLCFCSVVEGNKLKGLFAGKTEEAWSHAADLADKVHIVYKDRRFKKILGIAPKMYDDIWTAGKVMYKLESIVEDGGELIIYAPHITEVSYTHGKNLDEIGYHVRDYFLKQTDMFSDIPGCVMAHSTHVKGMGTFENGIETPRINVTLATGIPEERCEKINLGYRNPADINISEWEGREKEGILVVHNAGEVLHRLKYGKRKTGIRY